jgi:hypothetical protein
MTDTVIFAGPSIRNSRLRAITDAHIAGPIKRGDLLRLDKFDKFVIIDGEFVQSLSVSPKEILSLLDQKKIVIGAASMGALRASELDRDGMIGVGWVYRRFARAVIRRDDEVALVYSLIDFSPLTVPLVNVAYWTEHLRERHWISDPERRAILRIARRFHFADRSEERLLQAIKMKFGSHRLATMLGETSGQIPDIKELDAEEAVLFAAQVAVP